MIIYNRKILLINKVSQRLVKEAEMLFKRRNKTGSTPAASTMSERTLLRSDFSLQKNQSHAPSFLLFRKKARSARLFACKRAYNGSLSLPPFCESAYGANISMVRFYIHDFYTILSKISTARSSFG